MQGFDIILIRRDGLKMALSENKTTSVFWTNSIVCENSIKFSKAPLSQIVLALVGEIKVNMKGGSLKPCSILFFLVYSPESSINKKNSSSLFS